MKKILAAILGDEMTFITKTKAEATLSSAA
jgi:hypothetical protein